MTAVQQPRTPLEFLRKHGKALRRLQASEQADHGWSRWLSLAIEVLDDLAEQRQSSGRAAAEQRQSPSA